MENLFWYLGIYLIILFATVFIFRKKHDDEDFLISGRDRSTWQLMLSKFASTVGVAWLLVYTAYAYEFGLSMSGLIIGVVIGYLIFAYWAVPRIYRGSRENRFHTQGDFVENRLLSRPARVVSDSLVMLTYFMSLLVGVIGGGKVIEHLGLMSYELAVILTAVVIAVYLLVAGYRAIILTDIIQAVIILALLVVISFVMIGDVSLFEIFQTESSSVSIVNLISFTIYGLLSVYGSADRFLLTFAAKDAKAAKHSQAITLIPMIVIVLLLLVIGLFVRMHDSTIDPGLVFVKAMTDFLPLSILPIAMVMFFAGLMSSVDTHVYVIASQYAFLRRSKNPVKTVRVVSAVSLVIAVIVALLFSNIVDVTILLAALVTCPAIAFIYLISGKTNTRRFISSIIISFIAVIAGIVFMGIAPALVAIATLGGLIGLLIPDVLLRKIKL